MKRLLGLLLLFAASLFGALAMGVVIYYYLTYVLAFLLVVGLLWTAWNLMGVTARVQRRSLRAQVGGYLKSQLEVRNDSRFSKGWLVVNEGGDLPGHTVSRLVQMRSYGGYSGEMRTQCQRRGLFTVGPLQVESWDPLGLFSLRRKFGQREEVVVYPATVPIPHFHLFGSYLLGEEARRRHAEQPSSLASSVREYVPGDGVNRIHWPTTARMGELMVKQFDQGLAANLWILLDMEEAVQAGEGDDTSDELGVTIAASVAQRYSSMDVSVGVSTHGDRRYLVLPDSSPNHFPRILETLALAKARGRISLTEAVRRLGSSLNRYTNLVIITPSVSGDWPLAITPLLDRGVSVVAILVDPQSYGAVADASPLRESLGSLAVPTITVTRGQPLEEALVLSPRGGLPTHHRIPETVRR